MTVAAVSGPEPARKPIAPALRGIRSFVRRQGRITPAQQRALDSHWPQYGIDPTGATLDLTQVFGRAAPRYLEIGFGMGDALLGLATRAPEADFLGIEVHRPGVGRLLAALAERRIANVRVISADAVVVLTEMIADETFDGIYILFPDPWPKKRHHKRRLIQPDFIALLARKLRPGGLLYLATDWLDYAGHMRAVMAASTAFAAAPADAERVLPRPETKFERRGRRLGHEVWDLVYERRGAG